jgi:hypothetical protein
MNSKLFISLPDGRTELPARLIVKKDFRIGRDGFTRANRSIRQGEVVTISLKQLLHLKKDIK